MKQLIKSIIRRTPLLGDIVRKVYSMIWPGEKVLEPFPGSAAYWEKRYSSGGNSGVGSYGFYASFKAEILNKFVSEHDVQTVIEFGCGDGNQLLLANYPSYIGYDISSTAIAKCKQLFHSDETKAFRLVKEYSEDKADLTLSLDIIYHLVEDSVFENHMRLLFGASHRYAIIYSSNSEDNHGNERTHIRHRQFTSWIQENLPNWKLTEHVPNRFPYRGDYRLGSSADFFFFEKVY